MTQRLLYSNLVDLNATVITAVAVSGDNPASNLSSPALADVCRLTGPTKKITVDLGSDTAIGALCLVSTWLPTYLPLQPTDTLTINFYTTAQTPSGTPAWTFSGASGVAKYKGIFYRYLSSPITARYVVITVTRVDDVDISRLFLTPPDKIFAPVVGTDRSWRNKMQDASQGTSSDLSYTMYFDEGGKRRTWPLNWQKLSDSEVAQFEDMCWERGKTRQVVFTLFSDDTLLPKFTVIGTWADVPEFSLKASGDWTGSGELLESN